MHRSARKFSQFVPLCVIVAVMGLFLPMVQSETGGDMVIEQVTGTESIHACARFTAPPVSCPVNCFRANPVCGEDGVTYWCGCPDAMCHGVKVVKLGPCEVVNCGSPSLSQALLLVHIVWLFLIGFSLVFGIL